MSAGNAEPFGDGILGGQISDSFNSPLGRKSSITPVSGSVLKSDHDKTMASILSSPMIFAHRRLSKGSIITLGLWYARQQHITCEEYISPFKRFTQCETNVYKPRLNWEILDHFSLLSLHSVYDLYIRVLLQYVSILCNRCTWWTNLAQSIKVVPSDNKRLCLIRVRIVQS